MTRMSESRRVRKTLKRKRRPYRSDGLPKDGTSWTSYKTRRRKYERI
jgi:hypothetical protein